MMMDAPIAEYEIVCVEGKREVHEGVHEYCIILTLHLYIS